MLSEDDGEMNLLSYIAGEFAKIGVESPEAEARLTVEYFYGNDIFLPLEKADLSIFAKILDRRKQREPIQYIIGKAFFFNSEFIVNPSVLIPRPETEIMVEKLIEILPQNGVMADIGCGSGCIGISVALERKDVQVYAFDISSAALDVARRNSEDLQVKNITFLESDLLSACPSNLQFDAIGANLPYVPFADYERCADEVRKYEPELALTAADDGLEIIFRCAAEVQPYMKSGGSIFFEIDPSQDVRLRDYALGCGYSAAEIIKDYTDRSRFVKVIK